MRRWQVWFFGRWGQVLFWVAILAVGWALLGSDTGRPRWWWPFERLKPAIVEAPAGAPAAPLGNLTAVAKAAKPAVVNVASAKTVRGFQGPGAPFFSDPFFRFFPGQEPTPRRERSLGSGVVVTRDGYVLTTTSSSERRTSA